MTREVLPKGPLNIVPLSWKQNNHVQYAYEKNFAARIWRFRNLPGYAFMHRWAQKQIDLHCGDAWMVSPQGSIWILCWSRRAQSFRRGQRSTSHSPFGRTTPRRQETRRAASAKSGRSGAAHRKGLRRFRSKRGRARRKSEAGLRKRSV